MINLYCRDDRFLGINCDFEEEKLLIQEILNVKFIESMWIGKGRYRRQKITHNIVNFLFDDELGIYTFLGYKDFLIKSIEFRNFNYKFNDVEFDLSNIKNLDSIKNIFKDSGIVLYDFQAIAVQKSLVMKYGAVIIPTGGGKTEVIFAIIKLLNMKTVVVVPTIAIAEQFVERSKLRGLENVGIVIGKEKNENDITITTASSLHNLIKSDKKIEADVVVFDEFHHVQSESWKDIFVSFSKSEYMFGFTGTMYRDLDIYKNISDFTTLGISGRVIVDVSIKHLIQEGVITQPIVFVMDNPMLKKSSINDWNMVKNIFIEGDDHRNGLIAEVMGMFERHGFTTLVSVTTKKHAKKILEKLDFDVAVKTVAVYGSNKGIKYNLGFRDSYIDYGDVANDLHNGDISHIVSTSVFDEGVDLPSVNVIILGFSGKSLIKIPQKIGRGVRLSDGKNYTFIIDFDDRTHHYLENQFKKRINYYNSEGIPVIKNLDLETLFDGGINESCKKILQGRQ